MRTTALALLAAFGLAGCATGSAYDTYDLNADACLDRDEMIEARLADRNWTVDGTGMIADADFDRDLDTYGVFDAYDADADGYIEAGELGAWGNDLGDYDPWDMNEDNRIATSEFYDGLYDTWDANEDERLAVDEANEGYFAMWDANRDMCWDVNEYESSQVGVDFAT
jgi:hypothetical protein